MPEKYYRLHNDVDEVGFVINNPTVSTKVKSKLKMLAPFVGKAGDKVIGIPLIGTITAIVAVTKTGTHIHGLKNLKKTTNSMCSCNDCENYIDYAIKQKTWKIGKKCVGGIPIIGTVSTGVFKVRGAYKIARKTRGKNREIVALGLWYAMRGEDTQTGQTGQQQCQLAKNIVGELCGQKKVVEVMNSAIGWQSIVKKLASS